MALRKLLASIIAVTLLSGLPTLAPAEAVGDCVMVSGASADDGCCGVADMAGCSMACSVVHAAIGGAIDRGLMLFAASPRERDAARTRSVSRPPDTAPPKFFSA